MRRTPQQHDIKEGRAGRSLPRPCHHPAHEHLLDADKLSNEN